MKRNLVISDRLLRVAVGVGLLLAPLLHVRVYPVNLLGFVLIATSIVGYCPLYSASGWLARTLRGAKRRAA